MRLTMVKKYMRAAVNCARNRSAMDLAILCLVVHFCSPLHAVWDQGMNFQGRVLSNDLAFNGVGKFKFAIVHENDEGVISSIWSQDGSSVDGDAPNTSLNIPVTQGHYHLRLGDAQVMTSFPDDLFDYSNLHLRIWFDDGVNGESQLTPDLPITPVLFANRSKVAETVSSLPDEMVELKHLNAALQATLSDLSARLAFLESRGAMISNSEQDTGLESLGYVLYTSSQGEPPQTNTPANLPSARTDSGSSYGDNHWLVWGGKSSLGQPLASGGVQNILTGQWESTGALDAPAPRYDHVQLAVGDLFFIHGGQGASSFLDSAHLFDPSLNQWTSIETPTGLSPRIGHTAVTLNDGNSLIIFGGRTSDGLSNRFELLDVSSQTWDADVPTSLNNVISQRQNAQCARLGQWLLLWGGENESGPLSDGVRIDLANDYATISTPSGPSARTDFSMTVLGDRIAIWGGKGVNGSLNDGYLYDPVSNAWSSITSDGGIPARQEHQAYASGSELLFVGGDNNGQSVSHLHAYSTATATWREIVLTGGVPDSVAARLNGSKLTLVTGRFSSGGMNASMTLVDLTPELFYYRKP